MLFGPSAGGRFVKGRTAKQFDSALRIECYAADLTIHFVKNTTHLADKMAVVS